MKSDGVHIGVDVSKEKLDIYVPAKKEGSRPVTKEVDNDIKGFRELRDLARKAKATVCVEPTGGYELELIAFMHKFDVPVAYADALRVRQFARAEGNLSKNDTIDAALISRFADKIGARILEAQEVEAVELKRKAKFRQTMVDSRTAMINRLETEVDAEMKALLKEQIRLAGRIIEKAEKLCLDTVKKNERMDWLRERFTKVGGVGDLTAAQQVYDACRMAKVSIPGTVSVVGVDNQTEICESLRPTLTSIQPDFELCGYLAAELLMRRIRNPQTAPKKITYGIRLHAATFSPGRRPEAQHMQARTGSQIQEGHRAHSAEGNREGAA